MQNYSAWLTRNVSISLIDWKVLDNKENLPNHENGIGFVTKKTHKKKKQEKTGTFAWMKESEVNTKASLTIIMLPKFGWNPFRS